MPSDSRRLRFATCFLITRGEVPYLRGRAAGGGTTFGIRHPITTSHPTGRLLLMPSRAMPGVATIRIVERWFDELKRVQ